MGSEMFFSECLQRVQSPEHQSKCGEDENLKTPGECYFCNHATNCITWCKTELVRVKQAKICEWWTHVNYALWQNSMYYFSLNDRGLGLVLKLLVQWFPTQQVQTFLTSDFSCEWLDTLTTAAPKIHQMRWPQSSLKTFCIWCKALWIALLLKGVKHINLWPFEGVATPRLETTFIKSLSYYLYFWYLINRH